MPKKVRMIGPKVSDATISGMTMKKLKIPMYTPMRSVGSAVERIAYGIERIDAHAMPTPTMLRRSSHGSWMTHTERSPTAPHTRAAACTVFRLVNAASLGRSSATAKQVID